MIFGTTDAGAYLCAVNSLLIYDLGASVDAFSTRKGSALPYSVILGGQVHDIRTCVIREANPNPATLEGVDALVTNLPGIAVGVRTADCIPVLLFDNENKAVAAIHAGWNGTLRRIVNSAVSLMVLEYHTSPENLKAIIGPGISVGSFQVGEEIPKAFKDLGYPMDRVYKWYGAKKEGVVQSGHHIDLIEANIYLLELLGVKRENIQCCGIDTFSDTSFFSARRDGTDSGRIITSIKLL